MNNLYFICMDCKIFQDAGYRWAYWTLEHAGIVQRGKPISLNAVLSAEEYWNPPRDETSDWYYKEIFPSVRLFLQGHEDHQLIFGEKDDIGYGENEDDYFDWLEVTEGARLSLRKLVEQFGFKSWKEASEYISKQERTPWWWEDNEMRDKARAKFDEMIRAKNAG